MGGLLGKADARANAVVQKDAVHGVGIQQGGVLTRVEGQAVMQRGAALGIERGGVHADTRMERGAFVGAESGAVTGIERGGVVTRVDTEARVERGAVVGAERGAVQGIAPGGVLARIVGVEPGAFNLNVNINTGGMMTGIVSIVALVLLSDSSQMIIHYISYTAVAVMALGTIAYISHIVVSKCRRQNEIMNLEKSKLTDKDDILNAIEKSRKNIF